MQHAFLVFESVMFKIQPDVVVKLAKIINYTQMEIAPGMY